MFQRCTFLRYVIWAWLATWPIARISAQEWEVTIDPDVVVRDADLRQLLGGNAGLWYAPEQTRRLLAGEWLPMWRPALIRIPGGSWSDEIYWNGNGVRDGKQFDLSKLRDGQWHVDYSAYRPGFRVKAGGALSDYHGGIDVQAAHEFVRGCGSSALVTVNAGTGSPEMAAEWVRWANKVQGYDVSYWEVGNELEGRWEQGHYLPDGSEITPKIYADRFAAFARAMKQVDPTIKVGGPAASNDQVEFGEALLDQAGVWIDFVSYHTYPVGGKARDAAGMFAATEGVATGVKRLRELIRQKVPQRADQIEIGITEWHVGVHEGAYTVNQISGPWCAKWIGRMLESGADFANIWDLFSASRDGGHGVFGRDERLTPRGAFWALVLWNEELSGKLLQSEVVGPPGLAAFATRTSRGVSLLLVNESDSVAAKVRVKMGERALQGTVRARELSSVNYLWSEHARQPEWSLPPVTHSTTFDADGRLELPPLSAVVVHLDQPAAMKETSSAKPLVAILAPEVQPADAPFSAWVTLTDAESQSPWLGEPQSITVSTTGNLRLKHSGAVRLSRPAGRVELIPTGPGQSEVVVRSAAGETRRAVTLAPVEERPVVLWKFDEANDLDGLASSYALKLQSTVGSGSAVEIDLAQRRPGETEHRNRLLEFKSIPPCDRARVGGVQFQIRSTVNVAADPQAKLAVVLLSRANHWIPVGEVKLATLGPDWSLQKVRLGDLSLLDAMPDLYSVLIVVQTSKSLAGSILLEDFGFLMRH